MALFLTLERALESAAARLDPSDATTGSLVDLQTSVQLVADLLERYLDSSEPPRPAPETAMDIKTCLLSVRGRLRRLDRYGGLITADERRVLLLAAVEDARQALSLIQHSSPGSQHRGVSRPA